MIDFGSEVRTALKAQGKSLRGAAKELHYDVAYLSRVLNGKQAPSSELTQAINEYLGLALEVEDSGTHDDEMDAWELARRAQASDVGNATLERLERAFDGLAMAYPKAKPEDLLRQVRKHSAYVGKLLDGQKTLSQHRRLLVVGGWLSLLGATAHIDLMQDDAATALLETAATLAREAGHREIEAWCYETEAWRVLTDGDYVQAVDLSRAAQEIAPAEGSAIIQATAQEGRASARLGNGKETYSAVERVQALSAAIGSPDTPEHHYRYDPGKALSYTATTLAWLGDSAAEPYAREVIKKLSPSDDVSQWPRRVASANIDLALVLLKADRLDEACDSVQKAILSGRVVPSNHWRALEVVKAVEARQLPESADLREAYQGLKSIGKKKG
ncbi:XRE family transcriptional regulator [Streptomyces dangxiongensis]|uniref:XRE family transcriptional regulator n=1 Tax=Streptomyces dangxiongensis TaxID=1442032 RepID=A0A3G2JIN0_9ACTN|nr:helix-turn-helix transcriptional regulator [Streptomyces dangxiongensis]AYN42174.1 XRE family transcriptional regulator [Streptomyces dangxiongensis]